MGKEVQGTLLVRAQCATFSTYGGGGIQTRLHVGALDATAVASLSATTVFKKRSTSTHTTLMPHSGWGKGKGKG